MSGIQTTLLVARRQLREGLRGRTFLVSSVIVVAILAGAIGLPAVLSGASEHELGIVGAPPAGLERALDQAAEPFDATVKLRRFESAADAREAVADRDLDAALVPESGELLVRPDPPGEAVSIASAAMRAVTLPDRAQRLGVSPAQAEALLAPPLELREVEPESGNDDDAAPLAFGSTVLLFVALSVYGQTVLTSVVQEKSSRVVEVLLATLRPRHLLAGKVAGIGALGLAQIALLAVAALAADAAGLTDLPSIGATAPLALLWFVLGFALYAVAFAAVGALVSRIEDASTAALPVTMTMLAAYFVSFAGAFSDPDGRVAIALSLLPVSAPFLVPSRAALTDIPLWQHAAAVGLMLVAIVGLVRLGGRMYEASLLETGPRVPFRRALRAARG